MCEVAYACDINLFGTGVNMAIPALRASA